MTLGTNLSLRIAAILVAGFVLIQFLVFGATFAPGGRAADHPYSFPPPAELAAMVETLEQAPPGRRHLLVSAFDSSLYTFTIRAAPPDLPASPDATARETEQAYRAALPGRPLRLSVRQGLFPRVMRDMTWPGRLLSPSMLAVPLRSGEWLVLVSRPSAPVRAFLGERAALGALAGLLLLAALAWAVRQSTRPVTQLAGSIRTFADTLDAPDLPVTGDREVRELAAAYNEMKGRIAGLVAERTRILAGIAHDLRTYLTRLRLRAEFIGDPDQRERATRDLAEMSLLLDDTLLFAQPALRADAAETIALAEELRNLAETRREMGDAVTLEPVASDLAVMAERLALRRALANLIDNGLRHGSAVRLCAQRSGDAVEIAVIDDGPGVPEDQLARLGQPFDRLDPSRDRTTGGAGLGLAIVRALLDRQGGSLSFRNREAGGLEARLRLRAA